MQYIINQFVTMKGCQPCRVAGGEGLTCKYDLACCLTLEESDHCTFLSLLHLLPEWTTFSYMGPKPAHTRTVFYST